MTGTMMGMGGTNEDHAVAAMMGGDVLGARWGEGGGGWIDLLPDGDGTPRRIAEGEGTGTIVVEARGGAQEWSRDEAVALGAILVEFGRTGNLSTFVAGLPHGGRAPGGREARRIDPPVVADRREVLADRRFARAVGLPDRGAARVEAAGSREEVETAEEKADGVSWDAQDARTSAVAIRKLREAFSASACSADCYVLAANLATDPGDRLEIGLRGVEAGMAFHGRARIAAEHGSLWGWTGMRGMMRAMSVVVSALSDLGRVNEAEAWMRHMLHVNVNDNQGIRYELLASLAARGADEEVDALLASRDETTTDWAYGRLLSCVRRGIGGEERDAAVRVARRANPHVPDALGGRLGTWDGIGPEVVVGSKEEAVHYAARFGGAWARVGGMPA